MSHICSIKTIIKDLDALKRAAAVLGLELVEGQTTFKWYGKWMNDYSAPEAAINNGFDPKKFGQCEHAIRIPGNAGAYEVGVVKNPNGEGYALIYDNWQQGRGLEAVIGAGAQKLQQEYSVQVARKQAARLGMRVTQSQGADGKVRLVCRR